MLGVKVPKSTRNLGEKISKASYNLGNRYYSNASRKLQRAIQSDSKDGIENSGNGSIHMDPYKFNKVPRAPNYTTNITHSSIEKQRKVKPQDKATKFT
jgi:hypothetical protein